MKKHIGLFAYIAPGIFLMFESDSYFNVLKGSILIGYPECLVYTIGSFPRGLQRQ